jgi:hypothetical protein
MTKFEGVHIPQLTKKNDAKPTRNVSNPNPTSNPTLT